MAVDITILHTTDNVDWQVLRDMLQRALLELSLDAEVSCHAVRSDREALELGFIGSPTLLIDGVDPWPVPDAAAGLRLRPYFTDDGMVDYPTYEMLVASLKEHVEREARAGRGAVATTDKPA